VLLLHQLGPQTREFGVADRPGFFQPIELFDFICGTKADHALELRRPVVEPLPVPLAIMIWLVGAAWVVALMVYLLDAPVEIVWMVLFLGTGTGIIEWARRKS
jgi:hypothetical protein